MRLQEAAPVRTNEPICLVHHGKDEGVDSVPNPTWRRVHFVRRLAPHRLWYRQISGCRGTTATCIILPVSARLNLPARFRARQLVPTRYTQTCHRNGAKAPGEFRRRSNDLARALWGIDAASSGHDGPSETSCKMHAALTITTADDRLMLRRPRGARSLELLRPSRTTAGFCRDQTIEQRLRGKGGRWWENLSEVSRSSL